MNLPPHSKNIAIIGPSSSGKSTLANTLGRALGLPTLHLDQIAHVPATNWQRRPDDAFIAEHNSFIDKNPHWIIDGNYSVCMPRRLAKADTIIWCDPPLPGCIGRYIKRSVIADKERPGCLHNAGHEFNLALIRYTLIQYPLKRTEYAEVIRQNPHLRILHLRSFSQIKELEKTYRL